GERGKGLRPRADVGTERSHADVARNPCVMVGTCLDTSLAVSGAMP
ncbi:MAG: hypothetical protein ACI86S_001025, partial [Paracoccaceae bacterium]